MPVVDVDQQSILVISTERKVVKKKKERTDKTFPDRRD